MRRKRAEKPETLGAYIGNRIRLFREEQGLTQDELGERLGIVGATVSRAEVGNKQSFKIEELELFAKALNRAPGDFTKGFGANSQPQEGIAGKFSTIQTSSIDLSGTAQIPLIPFSKLGLSMESLQAELADCSEFFQIPFSVPDGNEAVAVKITTKDNDPQFVIGDKISIILGITPPPEGFVMADVGGEVVFRQFLYAGNKVILRPVNPNFKTYEFDSEAEFRRKVRIIGALFTLTRAYLNFDQH